MGHWGSCGVCREPAEEAEAEADDIDEDCRRYSPGLYVVMLLLLLPLTRPAGAGAGAEVEGVGS